MKSRSLSSSGLRWAAVLVVGALSLRSSWAAGPLDGVPQVSRIEFHNPGLLLNTPGRTGACDVLRFTPDGHDLLAAGDDKVVRMWPFDGQRLRTDLARVLRWGINREHRGDIYTLAISPEPAHRYLAVAGVSMISASTVAVVDRQTGAVVDAASSPPATHYDDVWTVAFSPSGQQIAYGSGDGAVWLWDRKLPRGRNVRLVGRHADKGYHPVRLVVFVDEHTLLSLATDGRLLEWDLTAPGSASKERWHFERIGHIRRVALSADNKLLAAFGDVIDDGQKSTTPGVEVRSRDSSWARFIAAGHMTYPNCLAFDPTNNHLAVGRYTVAPAGGFYNITGGDVVIYDLSADPPAEIQRLSHSSYPEAIGFHPDGKVLAVAGGNSHEVKVWRLGQVRKLLGQIAGPGRCLWSAGLSADGRYVGFRDQRRTHPSGPNDRGEGPWRVFDLTEHRFVAATGFQAVPPRRVEAGWQVEPDARNAYIWYAVRPDQRRRRIPLETIDDMPRCYTFLPASGSNPPRLVVGHYWGMSLFSLTDSGPRLERKFTGHMGPVMAVAPSADGNLLVTASNDETIAVWSLHDWPGQGELGATFSLDGDRLVVDQVAPGSPAWEANLTAGDEIVLLAYDRKLMLNRNASVKMPQMDKAPDIDACLERLRHPAPGKELVFVRKNQAGLTKSLTTVRQRPLWQFFPMQDDEWVLWRCRDYYYDTSPRGDSYIGWQLSDNIYTTPQFYTAEAFRQHYHRPDRVSGDALKRLALYKERPDPNIFTELKPPAVEMTGYPTAVAESGFSVRLSARPRGDRDNQQLDEVILWVNDYRYQRWTGQELTDIIRRHKAAFATDVDIPASELRHGENTLSLQCYNRARGRATTWKTVRYTGKANKQPRVLGLIVGVGNYTQAKTSLRPLGSAIDARELFDAWKHTRHYADGGLQVLSDAQGTRQAILAHLDALAAKAQPDDLVIVSLAGHGFSAESLAAEMRRAGVTAIDRLPAGTFAFCGPRFDYRHPSSTCVTSNDLYERLVRVRGHKLVLLDACHAGSATAYMETGRVSLLRELTRDGPNVGPVVLTACRPDETALEHPTIGEVTPATGLFAISVIRALGDDFEAADHNHDGRLTVDELASYARTRVGQMVQELKELSTGPIETARVTASKATADEFRQHPEASIPERESQLVIATR